jgi:cytochrome P450
MSRCTAEPIEIDGYTIPPNTNVILLNFLLHRNPQVFPNPDQFLPERFSEGAGGGSRSPYAYVPFSAGPRNCIGQK